jgi:hypothetical protein
MGDENGKFFDWTDLIDVLAVFGVAVLAYYPLKNHELATFFAILGSLIVISRLVLQSKVASRINKLEGKVLASLEPLEQLKGYIDLTSTMHLTQIRGLLDLYASITEPEFKTVKDRVLRDSATKLSQLHTLKRSDVLQTSAYYQWLLPMLDDIPAGEHLRAISLMNNAEWDDSQAERQFFQKHIAAAERGVQIDRIFIVERNTFPAAFENPAVAAHLVERKNGINGYLLYRDWFQQHEPESLKHVRDGFIIIGSRVALVDTFSDQGEVRGYVEMNPAEVTALVEIFEQLKVVAEPLSEKLFTPRTPQLQGHSAALPAAPDPDSE